MPQRHRGQPGFEKGLFMELMLQPLRKYADFQGRARRSEYWLFTLFMIIVSLVLYVPLIAFSGDMQTTGQINPIAGLFLLVLCVFALGTIIPGLAVTVRRLHDTDRSGWWILIGLIPFGGIVLLIFEVLDGTPGPNKFGPDPKGRGAADTFS
jgi:uncharacterized membrane protein YhaH (DUF805 family)